MAKRFSAEYKALLGGWQWQFLRSMVFNRDGWKCKSCGVHIPQGRGTKALHLECDHLRYPPKGSPVSAFLSQPLSDYQTLCNKCHAVKSNKTRKSK